MTALWPPSDLLAATGGLLRTPFAASGVSIDSRTVQPGALFIALATDSGDGHDFVADALARGAAGAMVHRLPDGVGDDAPLLQVRDTLEGLRALGAFARARFGGRVVAITGSVGKTTTKEMLRAVLAAFGRTWAAEASHNNHWGVPLTLARAAARPCLLRGRDRHEPSRRDRAAVAPGAPACGRRDRDHGGAYRQSGQHRGDRAREAVGRGRYGCRSRSSLLPRP